MTVREEINAAQTQAELSALIEDSFDLPSDESWGESADRLEAEGEHRDAAVLRLAEAKWFALAG